MKKKEQATGANNKVMSRRGFVTNAALAGAALKRDSCDVAVWLLRRL
jgi:hypothetical protein